MPEVRILRLTITETVIVLTLSQADADEGASPTVTVTATLSPADVTLAADAVVTVMVGNSGDSATEGDDYTRVDDFQVTIAVGATSGSGTGTFEFAVTDDDVTDPGETVTVSGTVDGFSVTPATLMINDEDAVILRSVSLCSVHCGPDATDPPESGSQIPESVGTVTFTATVELATTHFASVTGTIEVVGGSTTPASRGPDYSVTPNFGTIRFTIPAGQTSVSPTFVVTVVDDDFTEPDETIDVIVNLTGGAPRVLTLRIIDDDTTIILSVVPSDVEEDSGTTAVTVTAAYPPDSQATGTAIDVEVSVADGTAVESTDYTAVENFHGHHPGGTRPAARAPSTLR